MTVSWVSRGQAGVILTSYEPKAYGSFLGMGGVVSALHTGMPSGQLNDINANDSVTHIITCMWFHLYQENTFH